MKGLAVFLKKELTEQLRTKRLIIVAGVFLFFGFGTPLLMKYLPELIEMAGDIGLDFPLPTAIDSLGEYVTTMAQFGVLIIVLIAMGAIAKERESGTAMLVLSKPIGYPAFVIAKFNILSLTTLTGLILGGLASWGYTHLLFDNVPSWGFLSQNALLWLYFMIAIALTLLFSSIFRSQIAAGAMGLVTTIVLTIASSLPWVGAYLPGELLAWGNRLLVFEQEQATAQVLSDQLGRPVVFDLETAWGAVAVALVLIVLCLYSAWTILRKKEV